MIPLGQLAATSLLRRGGFAYGETNSRYFNGVHIGEPDSGKRYSAYFRCQFTTDEDAANLELYCQRDDGIIVYLDGEELLRDGVQDAVPDSYQLLASQTISGSAKYRAIRHRITRLLPAGEHVLAISLHNTDPESSDLRLAGIALLAIDSELNEE